MMRNEEVCVVSVSVRSHGENETILSLMPTLPVTPTQTVTVSQVQHSIAVTSGEPPGERRHQKADDTGKLHVVK